MTFNNQVIETLKNHTHIFPEFETSKIYTINIGENTQNLDVAFSIPNTQIKEFVEGQTELDEIVQTNTTILESIEKLANKLEDHLSKHQFLN